MFRLPDKPLLSPLVHLANNPVSFIGVLLATTGGVAWFFVLPVQLRGIETNPYIGILFFLVFPGMFFAGLGLIPLGVYLRFRLESKWHILPREFPPINWQNREFRRLALFVGLATAANVVIGGHFTYSAVGYMDSVSFCGQSCHTVMKPEFTAYQDSPHFRVRCTECHIGEGASWFVKSKLSGVRQVFAVMLNTYSRPIPTPVHDLRPARETCEACHWPGKFGGYRLRILTKFGEDDPNTATKTVLLMRIGGGDMIAGIHGVHLGAGVVIEYLSDPARQNIPWVRYTNGQNQSTEYALQDFKPADAAKLERRVMDCLDCHNRPSHSFELPEQALDRALATGRLPLTLPAIKKNAVTILKTAYQTTAQAAQGIPAALAQAYPDRAPEVQKAARVLLHIYNRNVFPEMNVQWGTYPNNIGHTYFPGCFRCHDDQHASAAGKTITQDCNSCHQLLAVEETNPEILSKLGVQ
jgi:hypothetical protein